MCRIVLKVASSWPTFVLPAFVVPAFFLATFAVPLVAEPVRAEPIRPGLYEVQVHVVLPNINTSDYDFTEFVCWRGGDAQTVTLGPLGRGPIRACPRDAVVEGAQQVILVQCKGPNAGFAVGTYRATPKGFRGQVTINLGGKNMTLIEEQRGTYLMPCP